VTAQASGKQTAGAYVGAVGGLVGIGAAVAINNLSSSVEAELGGNIKQASAITVDATDDTDLSAEAYGEQAGALAVGGVVVVSNKSGTVSSGVVKNSDITAGQLELQALSSGGVSAWGQASAGGLYSGSGVVATARQASQVDANIGSGSKVDAGDDGRVSVKATADTDASAEALGVNIGGVASLGAAVADTKSTTTVNATVTDADITAGEMSVNAGALATDELLAKSTAGTGAGLIGANATVATAASDNHVEAVVDHASTLDVTGEVAVNAANVSHQRAYTTGITVGGLLALGANVSDASSDATTLARLDAQFDRTAGTVNVDALGDDTNFAKAISGSGGVIDGSVVSATTDTQADTQALIQDHGSSPDKGVKARIIDVSALHTAEFNTEIDSTGAGVLHMSAARSDQSVDSNTLAGTGDSAHLQAANI